jgi:predicted  nucleic acid-binding Zn-ribbon protein
MSQARNLVHLQHLDTQLDQAKKRLEEIDAALNDNSAVRQAARRAEKAAQAHTAAQLDLRKAESEVQAQQAKIERNQKALYGGGKSPKELEDLQMESGALSRYQETLEERQLETMIALEEAEAADRAAQENLAKVKARVAAENSDLAAEQETLTDEVVELKAQRQNALEPIPADLLANYEKLRQTRFGLAVTGVRDGACEACGASLSAAQAQVARTPSKIAYCEVCGRILHA